MALKEHQWGLSNRGVKDAARHREKVKESIRKNIAEIISDASIITRKEGQVIKVPIRGLKSYRFIFRRESSGGTGVGQGEGEKGDVIGRQPDPNGRPGQAGDQPGVDYLETEIDIEELIQMMLQDLGLPNLRQKDLSQTVIPKGLRFESIEKSGLQAHLDKKRTIKAALQRTTAFVRALMERTGRRQEDCQKALAMARGDLARAQQILLSGEPLTGQPHMISLYGDDLRYRVFHTDVEYQSNAVVLAMMDVSGSMGTVKKYLARSFFFWMVEFLRKIYERVEIRFISHTTEARLVDEDTFFHKGESGGTFCHSAYDLATQLVETQYPVKRWNVYAFHFSDGEDFDPHKTVASARRLMEIGVNMVGYGEIQSDLYTASNLMETFVKEMGLTRQRADEDSLEIYVGPSGAVPFVGAIIREKSHIYLTLKEFLRKERPI
jgi:hypothetical protein